MTFAQRRNRLTTHFSERIAFAKRRMTMYVNTAVASCCQPVGYILTTYQTHKAVCSTMLQLTCTFWTLFHGTVFTQSHLAGHNMHTVKTSGIHRVCVPNLRIVQCTCSHTMVLCRRVHHSHTLRSQILTAPHSEAWELARLEICLYRRRFVFWKEERACRWNAFSDSAHGIRRDEAREVLTLCPGMTVDTVPGSVHNGTVCASSQDESLQAIKYEIWASKFNYQLMHKKIAWKGV